MRELFSWAIVLVFYGFGLGVLQVHNPKRIIASKVFFVLGAISASGASIMALVSLSDNLWVRLIASFCVFGLVGAGTIEAIKFAGHTQNLESDSPITKQTEKTIRRFLLPHNQSPKKDTDEYAFLVGNNCFILGENSQSVLVRVGNTNLISGKVLNGQLYITASIYGSDGKKVVEIKENDQAAETDAKYTAINPDSSTLEIRDGKGLLVFHVYYENPKLIKIIGDFYAANKIRIQIQENKVIYGDRIIVGGICLVLPGGNVGIDLPQI